MSNPSTLKLSKHIALVVVGYKQTNHPPASVAALLHGPWHRRLQVAAYNAWCKARGKGGAGAWGGPRDLPITALPHTPCHPTP